MRWLLSAALLPAADAWPTSAGRIPVSHPFIPKHMRVPRMWATKPAKPGSRRMKSLNTAPGHIQVSGQPGDAVMAGTVNDIADKLGELSASMDDKELCWWSYQTLPSPASTWNDPVNGMTDADAAALHALGELAVSRMQEKYVPGEPNPDSVAAFGGCMIGRHLYRKICDMGGVPTSQPDPCVDASMNQQLPWPTAIVIFKFKGSKIQQLKDFVTTWRNSEQTGGDGPNHAPQMGWAFGDQTSLDKYGGGGGWGPGGQILGKVVACEDIPQKYMHAAPTECDALDPDNATMTWNDGNYNAWKAACNLFYDPVSAPSGGGCPGQAPPPEIEPCVLCPPGFSLNENTEYEDGDSGEMVTCGGANTYCTTQTAQCLAGGLTCPDIQQWATTQTGCCTDPNPPDAAVIWTDCFGPSGTCVHSEYGDRRAHMMVGQTLRLTWTGIHDVWRVSGEAAYNDCQLGDATQVKDTSQPNVYNFVATQDDVGSVYLVCGIPGHCQAKQKINITVEAPATPEPETVVEATSPAASAAPSGLYLFVFMCAAIAAAML